MAAIRQRGKFWQAQIIRKGYPKQYRSFDTKTDAEKWARMVENEMDRGVFVSRAEAESTTLSEALDRYAREVTVEKKGARQELRRIENWKARPLANRTLASIRPTDLAAYRDARLAEGISAATIRLDIAVISHLFTIAATDWGMVGLLNPIKSIRKPRAPNARDRRLTGTEEQRLMAACEEYGHPPPAIVRFAMETAMRREEIATLRWPHVNLPRCTAHLVDTKNGDSRTVPLSSVALSVLKSIPRHIDGLVFGIRPDSITQAFMRACKRADIDGLRFHDLRHEATSRLFEKGLNPIEVAAITGHKTLQMLKRYTHLRAEDLARKLG